MKYIPVTSTIARGNVPRTWTGTDEPREPLDFYSPVLFSEGSYLRLSQGGVYFQEHKGDINNEKRGCHASASKGPTESFLLSEENSTTIIPVRSSGSPRKAKRAEQRHKAKERRKVGIKQKAPEEFHADPLAIFTSPPPNETPSERKTRETREAEEKRVSDEIDAGLREDKIRKQGERVVKVLLLGQGESGKSTTLKSEAYFFFRLCSSFPYDYCHASC
jgi:hypothetical protein